MHSSIRCPLQSSLLCTITTKCSVNGSWDFSDYSSKQNFQVNFLNTRHETKSFHGWKDALLPFYHLLQAFSSPHTVPFRSTRSCCKDRSLVGSHREGLIYGLPSPACRACACGCRDDSQRSWWLTETHFQAIVIAGAAAARYGSPAWTCQFIHMIFLRLWAHQCFSTLQLVLTEGLPNVWKYAWFSSMLLFFPKRPKLADTKKAITKAFGTNETNTVNKNL